MINQSFYRIIPTGLDINGPILSFTQTPTGISGQIGDNVSFIGVATATFIGAGNTATPTGSIAYRWYEGSVALSNGNRLSGTATTTLALSNIQFSDSSRVFYLEARFNPSAYGNGKNGRAINEPIYSNVIGASVPPPPPPPPSPPPPPPPAPFVFGAPYVFIGNNGAGGINSGMSVNFQITMFGQTSVSSNFGFAKSYPPAPPAPRYAGENDYNGVNEQYTINNITASTTYSVTANGPGGSVTAYANVNVNATPPAPPPAPPPPPPPPPAPPAPFVFRAPYINIGSSNFIPAGTSVSFQITMFNQTSASSNFGFGKSYPSAPLDNGFNLVNEQYTVSNITTTTTYTVTATGPGGTTTKSATITVFKPGVLPYEIV